MGKLPFEVIDYAEENHKEKDTKQNIDPLPESFGRNLDTLEKARLWLTNPNNWHKTRLFIIQWDGLLCTISEEHGRRLIEQPYDQGLPWCVVYEQKKRKNKNARGEKMDEDFVAQPEEE